MQTMIIGLIFLFVYLLVRLFSKFGAWISGTRFRAYRQLAVRYKGRYESRGLSDSPTVTFIHNGSTVRVGLAPTIVGQPEQFPRTRVVARFARGIPFRLELAPAARPAPHQPPKGTWLVKLGDPEFDRGFVVWTNDNDIACDFLSPTARRVVSTLQNGVHAGGMLVSVNPERHARTDRPQPGSENRSPGLGGPERARASRLTDRRGIRGGSPKASRSSTRRMTPGTRRKAPPSARSAASRYPGELWSSVLVCGTPHHRECWVYVGACSIYGCDGKVGEDC